MNLKIINKMIKLEMKKKDKIRNENVDFNLFFFIKTSLDVFKEIK